MADLKDVTINIADYITEERMAKIAEEELRNALFRCLSKESDVRRMLVNLSYEYAYKLIDEAWGRENFETMLKEQIEKTLTDTSCMAYEMFRYDDCKPGLYRSPAVDCMDEAVRESKPLIKERVEEIIKDYPFRELKEEICDTIYECIEKKFTTPAQSEPVDD